MEDVLKQGIHHKYSQAPKGSFQPTATCVFPILDEKMSGKVSYQKSRPMQYIYNVYNKYNKYFIFFK